MNEDKMPPQRATGKQPTIRFAPTSTSVRGTPKRNKSTIQNYAYFERIDENPTNPTNPTRTPKTPRAPLQLIQTEQDDIDIADDAKEEGDASGTSSEEEIGIDHSGTPTRHNLPSTITIKKRKIHRSRKPRSETTWTQHYFKIDLMDETWVNEDKPTKPIQQNRRWTCKLCGPAFSSTNKERHGNTSKLNNHMRDIHQFDKRKHLLGELPKKSQYVTKSGVMNKFTVAVKPIPSPEEAILRFFSITNQAFEVINHETFQDLYRSIGTTCPIASADTLKTRIRTRFNKSRRELASELDKDCVSFSMLFDCWGAKNHVHILGAIIHWITQNWERRSVVIEFAELAVGKSGKAMADVI